MMELSESIDIRDAFLDTVYEIAVSDRNLVFLTADMGAFSLVRFRHDLPGQFINVGIAEQNLISVAAGLTLGGKKVFVYGIIPFVTLRCLEQIKVDICAMKLPVRIIGAGPGLTYSSDGPTHHAIEDVTVMRAMPGMTIFNPCDHTSAQAAARLAYDSESPIYVRLDKGKQPLRNKEGTDFTQGVLKLKHGKDLLIVATGIMTHTAFDLAEKLHEDAIDAGIVDVFRIKPLDKGLFLGVLNATEAVVVLEEHTVMGGLGSAISELITDSDVNVRLTRIAIPDAYSCSYGNRDWMNKCWGLDLVTIAKRIKDWLCHAERTRLF